MPKANSFWNSVPGILTGLAALITAVGGIVGIYYGVRRDAPPATPTEIQKVAETRPEEATQHIQSPAKVATSEKTQAPGPGTVAEPADSCSRTYPDFGEVLGTRVLYFDSDESARGAAVFLNGKCQGYLGSKLSGRLEDNVLVNVPPGEYEIRVGKKGYQDFRTILAVRPPPPDASPSRTPKVLIRFELTPIQR